METLVVHATRPENRQLAYQSPVLAVANARMLLKKGWVVHIVDAQRQRLEPDQFYKALEFARTPRLRVTPSRPIKF